MALPPCHPLAELWPLMSETELAALTEDIRQHGQHRPITFAPPSDGRLLDGRNRWLACQRAGIEPLVEEAPEGTDLDALAWSLNEHRRHATEAVRALAAAKRATLRQGAHAPLGALSQPAAAKLYGVSRRSVQRARKVIAANNPGLEARVRNGETSLAAAVEETAADRFSRIYHMAVAGQTPPDMTRALQLVNGLVRFLSSSEPASMIGALDPATRQALATKLPVLMELLRTLARLIPPGFGQ